NNRRKYYPDFQFKENKVTPSSGKLIKTLEIDSGNESMVNLLIGFLASLMDFSNLGEKENLHPRYELLDNDTAFKVVVRDFKNRLEMGK
ncbi:hypothetical protein, partial [Pseudomonas viridiflava]